MAPENLLAEKKETKEKLSGRNPNQTTEKKKKKEKNKIKEGKYRYVKRYKSKLENNKFIFVWLCVIFSV